MTLTLTMKASLRDMHTPGDAWMSKDGQSEPEDLYVCVPVDRRRYAQGWKALRVAAGRWDRHPGRPTSYGSILEEEKSLPGWTDDTQTHYARAGEQWHVRHHATLLLGQLTVLPDSISLGV